MTEQEIVLLAAGIVGGLIVGILLMLLINRSQSGGSSPKQMKAEMENYQNQVEAHFEETSKKFKEMAVQYQDLYKHLSVGATSLCRPENVAPLLKQDDASLLASGNAAEDKAKPTAEKSSGEKTTSKATSNKGTETKRTDPKIAEDKPATSQSQTSSSKPSAKTASSDAK